MHPEMGYLREDWIMGHDNYQWLGVYEFIDKCDLGAEAWLEEEGHWGSDLKVYFFCLLL